LVIDKQRSCGWLICFRAKGGKSFIGSLGMPTDYHQRPVKNKGDFDWLSLVGILAALLILLATSIGYISQKIDGPRHSSH
jgi:hypothetical protein